MRNMVIYRLPVWMPAVLHSQSPLSRYMDSCNDSDSPADSALQLPT